MRCGVCNNDMSGQPRQHFILPEARGLTVRACQRCADKLRRGIQATAIGYVPPAAAVTAEPLVAPRPIGPPPAAPAVAQRVLLGKRLTTRENNNNDKGRTS